MQSTVLQPLPSRAVGEDDLLTFVNYELLEFLRQSRLAMNFEYHAQATLNTTGAGTVTTIWTSADMPTGSAWSVDAKATARATNNDGTDGRVDISGLFSRQGLGAAQTGATATLVSVGPHLLTFQASGSGVLVRVQDDGVHAVDWMVDVRVREVRS